MTMKDNKMTKTIHEPKIGQRSPWGIITEVHEFSEGIWCVVTDYHGGLKLSRKKHAEMPKFLRLNGPWYERDTDSSLVVLAFQNHFHQEQVNHSKIIVKNAFPEKYQMWLETQNN